MAFKNYWRFYNAHKRMFEEFESRSVDSTTEAAFGGGLPSVECIAKSCDFEATHR